ncbi:MAG: DUF1499 domain-containing protein [Gammaproteobacteria bacterium TMED1]|nr:MAG: DUF1499 domain-containing protein [Gammaproteobacteria bacterium TMED1]|tara:strand:+ start:1420 stop:2154 length:735 start_codon:yes stop_codon:yes gene_type:complete
MKESKISSRALLVASVIFVLVLASGPLGYKFGFLLLIPSIISLLVGVLGGILVALSSLIMLFVAIKYKLTVDRNLLLVGSLVSLFPMIFIVPQAFNGLSAPEINDISTDMNSPPLFGKLLIRQIDNNELSLSEYALSKEERIKIQNHSYPELKTLSSSLDFDSALTRSAALLRQQGLEIVTIDKDKGIIEAIDTTFWFGFKDNVVVRLKRHGSGTKVDIRSASRIGLRDFGKNAARIRRFLDDF